MGRGKLVKQLELARQRNDWREVAVLCNSLGVERQAAGDLQSALQYHTQEKDACLKLNDVLDTGVAHRRIGEVLYELGEIESALKHQNQHLRLAREAASDLEEQRAYATIGRSHLDRIELTFSPQERKKAIESASENFLKALQKCQAMKSGAVTIEELALMRCRLYLNLGIVLDHKNEEKQSVDLINKASALARQYSFTEDLFRAHFTLSTFYFKQQKIGLALEEGTLAASLSSKISTEARVDSNNNLGRLYVYLDNFSKAKHSFISAYKLLASDRKDLSSVKPILKAVSRLCMLEKENDFTMNKQEHLKLLEEKADLYSLLKFYKKSISLYKQVIEEAEVVGLQKSKLAALFYSLARTYHDDEQFSEAQNYYKKEYDIRVKEEPKEACKTLLAIAEIEEQTPGSSKEVYNYYNQALSLAKVAKCPKLELHVLRLCSGVENLPDPEKNNFSDRMKTIMQENDLDSDCVLSEDEEQDESDIEFPESDEELGKSRGCSSNSLTSRNIEKTNDFGETPLHKACIDGNLQKAKFLIKEGHSVNVRDKAGWLPLHEASNHGHVEIVQFLLSVGAHINDRGGRDCSGITPLHDAAANGNMEVINILLQHKASVIRKNNDGETPLMSLMAYKKRSPNLSDFEVQEIEEMACTLRKAMLKEGYVGNPTELESNCSSKKFTMNDSPPRRRARREMIDSESDSSPEKTRTIEASASQSHKNAVSRYREAINSIGSALNRNDSLPLDDISFSSSNKKNKAKRGLIEKDEFVGEKDFFENDVKENPRKRKRLHQSRLNFSRIDQSSKVSNKRSDTLTCIENKLNNPSKQSRVTSFVKTILPVVCDGNVEDELFENPDFVDEPREFQSRTENGNISSKTSFSSTVKSHVPTIHSNNSGPVNSEISIAKPMRIRVKIKDKILLVPVAESSKNRTIEWLCSEVSSRYYQIAGIKPTVELATSDGALLHPYDPITMVLGEQKEELTASVSDWVLPPLHLRYTQDCAQHRMTPCPRISVALASAESSSVLHLQRVTRNPAQLKHVARALQHNQNLHTLSLAYTCLGDEGFTLLLDVLPTLSALTILDVQGCGLTHRSLSLFSAKIPTQFSKCLMNSVNLSYNSFQASLMSDIAGLLALPHLTSLQLQNCLLDLTDARPLNIRSEISSFNIDYNSVSPASLRQLLLCMPRVETLSMRGLHSSLENNTGFASALIDILGDGEHCHLRTLDVTFAGITDEDLVTIQSYLYRCTNLSSLTLACNTRITEESLLSLTTELLTITAPISTLHLHGIDIFTEQLSQAFSNLLHVKSGINKPLKSFSYRINSNFDDLISKTWEQLLGTRSSRRMYGNDVFLDCQS